MGAMEPCLNPSGSEITCLADSRASSSTEPQVILVSDEDSDSESSDVEVVDSIIILDDTIEKSKTESEVILLDDSVVSTEVSPLPIKIDRTPDFIPVPNSILDLGPCNTRNWRKKRKLANKKNVTSGVQNQQKKQHLKRKETNDSEKDVQCDAPNQQKQYTKRRKWQSAANSQGDGVPNSQTEKVISDKLRFNKQTPVIQLSYPNILNSNADGIQTIGLRPVIIDGCNVGFGYGNGDFKMQGIFVVIQYFKNRGHEEIVCFLPQRFRHRVRSPSEERIVASFEKDDIFSFTPSRNLDDGTRITPYDDRYIVQYASERQGVIISNDGYRDLINEEPSWRETIEKRIINYTFARGLFMLPKDPLGPTGPTLDEMLKFP